MNLDEIRHLVTDKTQRFLSRPQHAMRIGDAWVPAARGATLDVLDPADERVIARVPAATAEDVDRAVQAAHAAFEAGPWPRLTPAGRQRLMLRLADLLERDARTFAEVESIDNGKSAQVAQAVDVALAVDFLRYMAGWATKIEGSTSTLSVPFAPPGSEFVAYTRREPVGVVAAIVPWNFPLLMAAWKLGPALAAGCTVVLKPAEQTPLSALLLGELIEEAGFPPGVVNIVTGDGASAGAPLAAHPLVGKISFTGSTATGKRIGHAAIDHMTRVTLELGGKSPVIVLDDCDPARAAAGAAQAIFFNHGQVCSAGSRLYVQRSRYDEVVDRIARLAEAMPLGAGLDPAAQMGPLVSRQQMDRVCGYIADGLAQGAELRSGGGTARERGYFVQPTVLAGVRPEMNVVREEIFGPVLVAMPYDDIDEVAAWANDTPYGLGASIWSNDLARVHRLIPRLKAGSVWVNCHSVLDPSMPFGGMKQSGYGRDMGRASLESYLEHKSVVMAV